MSRMYGDGAMSTNVFARKADLIVRLAACAEEVAAAQALRYRVFYEELGARPDKSARRSRRDEDRFDCLCDHLLVVRTVPGDGDAEAVSDGSLVGTYRLLRQETAEAGPGFYTQDEFDIAPLIARHPTLRFLELGRSCVLAPYRTRPVVELLWQGIWDYVRGHRLDVMIGCASLEGTDPEAHAVALSFLARQCAAEGDWQVSAHADRHIAMDRLGDDEVDPRRAMRALPPLIKGYLRLGARIGDGAVIDTQFNTIDVLIVLPVSAIDRRYFSRFGAPGQAPVSTIDVEGGNRRQIENV